jgi:hypothetical protein
MILHTKHIADIRRTFHTVADHGTDDEGVLYCIYEGIRLTHCGLVSGIIEWAMR